MKKEEVEALINELKALRLREERIIERLLAASLANEENSNETYKVDNNNPNKTSKTNNNDSNVLPENHTTSTPYQATSGKIPHCFTRPRQSEAGSTPKERPIPSAPYESPLDESTPPCSSPQRFTTPIAPPEPFHHVHFFKKNDRVKIPTDSRTKKPQSTTPEDRIGRIIRHTGQRVIYQAPHNVAL